MLNFCCDICGKTIKGRYKKVLDESTTLDFRNEKNEICMDCWNTLKNSAPAPAISFPNSEADHE